MALLLSTEGELCTQEDTKHKLASGYYWSMKEKLPVTEFFSRTITSYTHMHVDTHTQNGKGPFLALFLC